MRESTQKFAIQSMTGFGRAEAEFGDGRVSVEVRTVNSRHLDVRVRAGRELTAFERTVRTAVARHFARGAGFLLSGEEAVSQLPDP